MTAQQESYKTLRRQSHPRCVVCGAANGNGLGLEFRTSTGGVVEATFACERVFEGYPDIFTEASFARSLTAP